MILEPIHDGDSQQQKDITENTQDGNARKTQGEDNTHLDDGDEKVNEVTMEGDGVRPLDDDRVDHHDSHDGFGDLDEETLHVVYVDPETGETIEALLGEVPEGAKIIEIKEDPAHDDGSIASGRQSRQKKGQKSVTFNNQQSENNGKFKSFSSKQKRQDVEGDPSRSQRGWGPTDRMYVVPSGDTNPNLQEDLVIKGLRSDSNVSPLTIFALARSRKENAAKQARRAKSARSRVDYRLYSPEKNDNRQDYDAQAEPQDLHVTLPTDEADDVGRSTSQLLTTDRVKSGKKPEDDVVKWCIHALRKSRPKLSIPEKPSRPGSSQSVSIASDRRDDVTWVKKVGIKEGKAIIIISYHHHYLHQSL